MKDLEWKNVLGRRVLAVNSHGLCNSDEINCTFRSDDCRVTHNGESRAACNVFATGSDIFITQDQLPEYLAQRLTGQS